MRFCEIEIIKLFVGMTRFKWLSGDKLNDEDVISYKHKPHTVYVYSEVDNLFEIDCTLPSVEEGDIIKCRINKVYSKKS